MSTLSVSSIQNTASPTTNIVVNSDGSVTLGLYRIPGVAPTPVQTGTLWYDIGGAGLVIWNGTSWAGVGGGGGGTVTGVAGTAPIVSSGGATPAISITPATSGAAGSMSAADKAKLDGAATIVSSVDVSGGTTGLTYTGGPITGSGTITMAGTLAVANGGTGGTTVAAAQASLLPAQTAPDAGKVLSTNGAGVLSWAAVGGSGTVTNVTGTLPITVATGTTTPVIAINAATNAAAGAIEIATLAEAATGTDATLALTPQSGVPKDASGMTGAALLPIGTLGQRPTPVAGMLRMNTTLDPDSLEAYDGAAAAWKQIAYVPVPSTLPASLTISANTTLTDTTYVVNNLTIDSGVTATLGAQSVVFICYGDVNIAGSIDATGAGPAGGFTSASNGAVGNLAPGANIGTTSSTPANAYQPLTSTVGSGGSSGIVLTDPGGGAFSYGGRGGGAILIRSYKNITVSGTLSAPGGFGTTVPASGTYAVSGSGGGSGGSVVFHASGNINFSGTINVAGGAGIAGVINGYAIAGMNGGGGGGGGYVILEADTTLTNTGTITLTGGAAGATTGTSGTIGGGSGGSFGGKGGKGAGPGAPLAGDIGVFTTAGSPI